MADHMEVDGGGGGGIIGAGSDRASDPTALDFPPQPPGRTERVSFARFCDLLDALSVPKPHAYRVKILRDFRETYLTVSIQFCFVFSFSKEVGRRRLNKKVSPPSSLSKKKNKKQKQNRARGSSLRPCSRGS